MTPLDSFSYYKGWYGSGVSKGSGGAELSPLERRMGHISMPKSSTIPQAPTELTSLAALYFPELPDQ